jgi:hypothetical protein
LVLEEVVEAEEEAFVAAEVRGALGEGDHLLTVSVLTVG